MYGTIVGGRLHAYMTPVNIHTYIHTKPKIALVAPVVAVIAVVAYAIPRVPSWGVGQPCLCIFNIQTWDESHAAD